MTSRDVAERVHEWVVAAAPGTKEVYHEGWLISDRETNEELDWTASALHKFAKQGLVHLTQTRLGDMKMAYTATRARLRAPALRAA